MQQDREPRYVETIRSTDGRLLSMDTFVLGPLSRYDALVSGAALFLGVIAGVRLRDGMTPDAATAPFIALGLVAWVLFVVAQWQVSRRRWRDEGVPDDWFRMTSSGLATLLQLWVLALTSLALAVYALGG